MAKINADKIQAPMRQTHSSRVNLTYEWRKEQLKKLSRLISENRTAMCEAVSHDLGRISYSTNGSELVIVEKEIDFALKNLKKWMQPKKVPSSAIMVPCYSSIEHKPLDSPGVLIIGPFNYPFHLTLRPLVGALAGGNPTVIKPSELCVACSKLMKDLVDQYFDPGAVQVVLGSIPETTALLEKPWGKVMLTGSSRVGKIIGEACAKTLTPTILELGGKSPNVVDESVKSKDLQNAADRIIFGKLFNGGQTCVAPDVLFVHTDHAKALSNCLVQAIEAQYGKDQKSSELARIIDAANVKRLQNLIFEAENDSASSVIYGKSSDCDVASRYVCPTIIVNPPFSSKVMQEEIFGPILPVITFSSRAEAIERIQSLPGTPLQFSIYTPKEKVFKEYTDKCRSAGAFQNDSVVQNSNLHLPFAGLGTSGNGCYVGKFSFYAFTHVFPVAKRPLGRIWDIGNLRCPPYAGWRGKFLEDYVFPLPDIPVMNLRLLFFVFAFFSVALSMPEKFQIFKFLVADLLQKVVNILRE